MPDSPTNFPATPWVIKPQVPDEIFTDRQEFLEYFYQAARKAAERRTMSSVLLGQRRMGKTEIFRRVVNRLFFEQDPSDPKAVVPVYYLFPDTEQTPLAFALDYLENFMRYYLAFYTQRPEIIIKPLSGERLVEAMVAAQSSHPGIQSLDTLVSWHESMSNGDMPFPQKVAVEIPRRVADADDSTIAVFLDEFQNIHLPQHEFNIVGYMQSAVESNTCPHFVTGSAMSILAREILGRGALWGRFDRDAIQPLTEYWGAELAKRAARYYQADVPELMAPVLANRCGGNPFYISALLRQAAKQGKALTDEEAINGILAIDLASGFIWGELSEQVNGWIERINEYGITKWILYLSALEEGDEISLERIQQQLKAKEGKEVPLATIREVLIRLSGGDLLEYRQFGNWFHKIDDPILVEFLKVWGRIDVERENPGLVRSQLDDAYRKTTRRIAEYKGYLAEVFMAQVLLCHQNRRKQPLPGRFFNSDADIELPAILHYLNHRARLGSGKEQEIDILAAFSGVTWVCQSKWLSTQKTGVAAVEALLAQAATVQAERTPISIHTWLFAHEGLTPAAEALARKEGVFWSNRQQLDGLLTYLGLRTLPVLDEEQVEVS